MAIIVKRGNPPQPELPWYTQRVVHCPHCATQFIPDQGFSWDMPLPTQGGVRVGCPVCSKHFAFTKADTDSLPSWVTPRPRKRETPNPAPWWKRLFS